MATAVQAATTTDQGLAGHAPSKIQELITPCLLLDEQKLDANIKRMANYIGGLGCKLRPHVKTNKSIDVTQRILAGGHTEGICVSTLKEAEYFFERGITDILYAVGIAPNKLDWAASLKKRGCALQIALDSVGMAQAVAEHGAQNGVTHDVLIELDTDGHRSGVAPEGDTLLAIGDALSAEGAHLLGVMTHAGESYNAPDEPSLRALAKQERDRTVLAASRLREAGHACPVVSVGSTPTALFVDDLNGVTEVRAGVYAFFDLVMAGIGVCTPDDVAVSVLASIIGHQEDKGWAISDAGWMAMSRDRGTAQQKVDQGYGIVTDLGGARKDDVIVRGANQEHGIISLREGQMAAPTEVFPLGSLVRVLPNHACSTASQYDRYIVVCGEDIVAEWPRINGW
ncbi:MAG: alanine racemase [Pseudomonadota bacterium]